MGVGGREWEGEMGGREQGSWVKGAGKGTERSE